MALAVIIFLLAIISAVGMAFLYRVGALTAASTGHGSGMQAEYLAESAANHALWRLLNEPGFPAKEDVYYMHSLGPGRYGYKVRRPTATTFAAVATVGGVTDQTVHQSYVPYIAREKVMTVYGDTSSTNHPFRRLVGASFDPANPTIDIGHSEARWVELEGHPFSDELVAGFLDSGDDIELAVWDGSAWGNHFQFIATSKKDWKCFEIAYDSYTGDALALGWDINQPSIVLYSVWDRVSWSAPAQAFAKETGAELRHIEAEGNPTNGEILIAALDADLRIVLYRWDGSTFDKLGILETNAGNDKWMTMDIVFEQQSGEGMVVWADASSSVEYVTTNGPCTSSTASLPAFPTPAVMVRAAADPSSDFIFLMAFTLDNDINAAVWDGTSWTDFRTLETNPDQPSGEYMNFDVVWEDSGSEAIAAWGKSIADCQVRYIHWLKGTALSSCTVETGPKFQNYLRSMHLCPVPGSDRIVLACNNATKELRYCLWDGDQFRGDPRGPPGRQAALGAVAPL
jgi:hypothetical protein